MRIGIGLPNPVPGTEGAALELLRFCSGAQEGAAKYLKDYYGFLGEWADRIAGSARPR